MKIRMKKTEKGHDVDQAGVTMKVQEFIEGKIYDVHERLGCAFISTDSAEPMNDQKKVDEIIEQKMNEDVLENKMLIPEEQNKESVPVKKNRWKK